MCIITKTQQMPSYIMRKYSVNKAISKVSTVFPLTDLQIYGVLTNSQPVTST